MKRNRKPQKWQKDPNEIKTSTVQFWRNGIMVTAQMSQKSARQAVTEGDAFVISNQAVGAMINGEMSS